jgi:beta-lactamase regulating signal transducer with metallopeptidase domain
MNVIGMNTVLGLNSEFCASLCLTLAHSLWQIALLALAATLVVRSQRGDRPERAYAIYVVALLAALMALPVTFAVVNVEQIWPVVATGELPVEDQTSTVEFASTEEAVDARPAPVVTRAIEVSQSLDNRSPEKSFAADWMLAYAPWLVGCYFAGVVLMVGRLGWALWKSQRLARHGEPLTVGPVAEAFKRLIHAWEMRIQPVLTHAQDIVVPQVVGFLRPTILLPTSALSGLTPAELEMILAHELAHVRRLDMWVNLVQRLAEAVLFFNPALWYLSRQISTYREYCCDEQTCRGADTASHGRVQYAQALLRVVELAKRAGHGQQLAALAATGNRPSELRRRVARLFGEPLREPVRISRSGLIVLLAGLVLLFTIPMSWQNAAEVPAKNSDQTKKPQVEFAAIGTKATISGRIQLEDGTPATTKGWMYYSSKQANANHVGTDAQYTDRFSSVVPPGKVWLRYFPDGFAPVAVGPFELKAGEKRDDITIVLNPGFSQPVRIVGADNQPLAEATLAADPVLGGESGGYQYVNFTNDQGECLLTHVADTAYELVVNAPGHETLRSKMPQLSPDEPLVLTMKPSEPATGIVRNADGSPAGGAKIYCAYERLESGAILSSLGSGYGKLVATTDGPPTDSVGRFSLDQLTGGSQYFFVIEAADGARAVVTALQPGQQDVEIKLPKRHDLLVRINDLSQLPNHEGKPRLSVRQRFHVPLREFGSYSAVIGEDVPIELTKENGAVVSYPGLAVELDTEASQMVEVSLDYPNGPEKIVRLQRDGMTLVEFQLPNQVIEDSGHGAERSTTAEPQTNAAVSSAKSRLAVREVTILSSQRKIDVAQRDPRTNVINWSPREGGSETITWPSGTLPLLTEADVAEAKVVKSDIGDGLYDIQLKLTPDAGRRLGQETERLIKANPSGVQLAVIFDNQVLMAPRLMSAIREEVMISGQFDEAKAKEIAERIKPGVGAKTVDSEKIAALKELVDSYEADLERVETLFKVGAEGGEPATKALAQMKLSVARADLAQARGEVDERIKQLSIALAAAEELVADHAALHAAGRVTLDVVLAAKQERARIKILLAEAREAAGKAAEVDGADRPKVIQPKEMLVKVVDTDGKPLEGAWVFRNLTFNDAEAKRSRIKNETYYTDKNGETTIRFEGEPINLHVWVKKESHVPLVTSWRDVATAGNEPIPASFEFRLTRGTKIGGIVTDVAGIPIAGVKVEVEDASLYRDSPSRYRDLDRSPKDPPKVIKRPGRSNWLAFGTAGVLTDAEGKWSLDNVPTDAELLANKNQWTEGHTPLRLRFSHPDYETIDGMENHAKVYNPTLESLRDGSSRTEMKWVNKDAPGRVNAVRLEQGEQYKNADFSGRILRARS